MEKDNYAPFTDEELSAMNGRRCPFCRTTFSDPPTEAEQRFMENIWRSSPPPPVPICVETGEPRCAVCGHEAHRDRPCCKCPYYSPVKP